MRLSFRRPFQEGEDLMPPRFCRFCGKQTRADARFCIECGSPLASGVEENERTTKTRTKVTAGSVWTSTRIAQSASDPQNEIVRNKGHSPGPFYVSQYPARVPEWNTYFPDLRQATKQQREFYEFWRNNLERGLTFDIEGILKGILATSLFTFTLQFGVS
jgi:hypothetical protein